MVHQSLSSRSQELLKLQPYEVVTPEKIDLYSDYTVPTSTLINNHNLLI